MKTIILDDNIEYIIIKELIINKNKYTLFANINNPEEICLRKTIKENNKEYYIGLDNPKEVEDILIQISKEYLNKLKESEK